MAKRIILIAIAVVLVAIAYFAWTRRNMDVAMDDGSVSSHDTLSGDADRMNRGAVDLDGNPMSASSGSTGFSGASSSTAPRSTTGSSGATSSTLSSSTTTSTTAMSPSTPTAAPAYTQPPSNPAVVSYRGSGSNSSLPATDSLAENQPDGMRFGGSGKFQWYRQGNLTWRVNTQNGAACIAFATMDEWQKPLVYRHGCGNG